MCMLILFIYFSLYFILDIPSNAPKNVSIAVILPTISSPHGRFQIFTKAKYKVPSAGNSI